MALDDKSLVELKKIITLGLNKYRLFEGAEEVLNEIESLVQAVVVKKKEISDLELELGRLNNSLLSAKGKLKEAQEDSKAILAGAHEEYDAVIAKAKQEAEKIKLSAQEKADKEYAKVATERVKLETSISELKEISAALSLDVENKTQELNLIEEKLATVKEQIARLAGA